jgi:AcrR family transcriptional regulator
MPSPNVAATAKAGRGRHLRRDSARTRDQIFRAALAEFSREGYSGARVERIAARSKCNIRMVYLYFGNKERLYRQVLEEVYDDIRAKEQNLQLESLDPLEGMIKLLDFTFDHFRNNPDFVALLRNENLMRGKFVSKSKHITALTSPLRHAIEVLLRRGQASGVFPHNVDPIQIYITIAGLSWHHLGNVYTLSAMFGRDLTDDRWRDARRDHVREVVMAYLTSSTDRAKKILQVELAR